jgi:hypothetical protein
MCLKFFVLLGMNLLHTAKCQRGEPDNLRGCVLLMHKTTSLSVPDLILFMYFFNVISCYYTGEAL